MSKLLEILVSHFSSSFFRRQITKLFKSILNSREITKFEKKIRKRSISSLPLKRFKSYIKSELVI